MYQILIVDDDDYFLQSLKNLLVYKGFQVDTCANPVLAMQYVQEKRYQLILLDVKMPGMDGIELLEKIRTQNQNIPVVMVSGQSNISIAVEAIKKGAFDFVEKPVDPEKLQVALKNALDRYQLWEERSRLIEELKNKYAIVGKSEAINAIIRKIEQVAESDAKVLITGETGTGKELVARALHLASNRSSGPFVKLNCAAIPTELLESELFGHKKGSFTGAIKDQTGKFQAADGGTLFLDEIGDMDLVLQAKLLHVLQDNEFMMLGAHDSIKVDVRIITATNQNINDLIAEGKFRRDLFHRINVVNIHIPPLRERVEDIEPLAIHFLKEFAETYNKKVTGFEPGVLNALKKYSWPGNVRELRNVVEKMVIFARDTLITQNDLKESLLQLPVEIISAVKKPTKGKLKEEMQRHERELILRALKAANGSNAKAAKILGIDRSSLFKKRKKLGI